MRRPLAYATLLLASVTAHAQTFSPSGSGGAAVDQTARNAAQAAQTTATAAEPANQSGVAGGYAPLDTNKLVPAANIPFGTTSSTVAAGTAIQPSGGTINGGNLIIAKGYSLGLTDASSGYLTYLYQVAAGRISGVSTSGSAELDMTSFSISGKYYLDASLTHWITETNGGAALDACPATGDNSFKVPCTSWVQALVAGAGYASAPTANGALLPTSYTLPTSGTAPPSGAVSQDTTNFVIIPLATTAPASGQVNAVQLALPSAAGYGRLISNQSNYPVYVFPHSSGTLSLQAANVPLVVSAGFVGNFQWYGGNVWSIFVGSNYASSDPSLTFQIPANIPANTCQNVPITEPLAQAGDRPSLTNIASAPLTDNLTVSAIIAAYQAGSFTIKVCNDAAIVSSGQATSPTLAYMASGKR